MRDKTTGSAGVSTDGSPVTFDTVVELLSMLDGSELPTRIEFRNGPIRLSVERGMGSRTGAAVVPTAASAVPSLAAAENAAPSTTQNSPKPSATTTGAQETEGAGTPVRAAIAGVFYRAPGPDADPFVVVGQRVSAGDTIGIVEVMKLMNTVSAGVDGVVTEVCVDNGQLVEFEQVLVRIDPEG